MLLNARPAIPSAPINCVIGSQLAPDWKGLGCYTRGRGRSLAASQREWELRGAGGAVNHCLTWPGQNNEPVNN